MSGRSKPPQSTPARPSALARGFAASSDRVAHFIGQPQTFILLCAVFALWTVASFVLGIPGEWDAVANAVGIVTFLMVFLIQSTQNRNSAAVQAKLDELIRALEPAENRFRGIEKLTIEEVHELRDENEEAADAAKTRPSRRSAS